MGLSPRQIRKIRETATGYAFLTPNIIGFLVFTFLPIIAAFWLSLVKWDVISGFELSKMQFVGLGNFEKLLGFQVVNGVIKPNDPKFWYYMYNTAFMMIGIPLGMAGSLAVALLMNQKLKGISIFRTAFFLPTISSIVAIALLWKWIYSPDYGLINALLTYGVHIGPLHLHIPDPPKWLASKEWAKPAIILMWLWRDIGGYNCILYLAGLQQIPEELYEAADIDGAGSLAKFKAITLPMLSPTTFFILTMSLIGGFQGGFTEAYLMTEGGPAGSTTTVMYYIYSNGFQWFKMGYAAALSVTLFAAVFVSTLFNWRFGGRLVYYS